MRGKKGSTGKYWLIGWHTRYPGRAGGSGQPLALAGWRSAIHSSSGMVVNLTGLEAAA